MRETFALCWQPFAKVLRLNIKFAEYVNMYPSIQTSLLVLLLVCGLFSCQTAGEGQDLVDKVGSGIKRESKIGLALGVSGLGDQSFNDMQYSGLVQSYTRMPINAVFRVPASNDEKDLTALFEALVLKDKCRLIIVAEAYAMGEVVKKFAVKHPDVFFVLMESSVVDLPNIAATEFAQNEGSFLAGMLAARVSKAKRFGFIGGVDLLPVKDFLVGYEAGIRRVSPDASIETVWVSRVPDFGGFTNPARGNQLALAMYDQGIEVVYSVAGGTGNGIIQAARERDRLVIGVDSNQDHLAPGNVLTSMMKRADVAVTNIIGRFLAGTLQGRRVYRFDLKNYGVSLTDFEYTGDKVPSSVRQELTNVSRQIADGRLVVPTTLR
jgi:basic membrane protein A